VSSGMVVTIADILQMRPNWVFRDISETYIAIINNKLPKNE
jgi:hypothetical protein